MAMTQRDTCGWSGGCGPDRELAMQSGLSQIPARGDYYYEWRR
jgi:hypothetical protein